jgi:hypothetical protein
MRLNMNERDLDVGEVTLRHHNPSLCPSVGFFDFYLTSGVVKALGPTCIYTHVFNAHTPCCWNAYGTPLPTQTPIMFPDSEHLYSFVQRGTRNAIGQSVYV